MTSLNIDSIQNKALKRAADVADSKGENSFNKNLDQNELSVFIKNAYQNNVSTEEIMEVVNQVGFPEDEGDETQKTIATLHRLEELEKELAARKETREEMTTPKEKTIRACLFSGIGGITTGIAAFIQAKKPYKVVEKEWLYPRTIIRSNKTAFALAALAGAIIGVGAAALSKRIGSSEQMSYEARAIDPLKNEIKKLKQEFQKY